MLVRWRKQESCVMDVKSRICIKKEIRLIVSDSDLQREQSSLKEKERQSRWSSGDRSHLINFHSRDVELHLYSQDLYHSQCSPPILRIQSIPSRFLFLILFEQYVPLLERKSDHLKLQSICKKKEKALLITIIDDQSHG